MVTSIQQFYRNKVLMLCIVLMLLLTMGLTLASFLQIHANMTHELQTQANMLAIELVDKPNSNAEAINKLLQRAAVNPALELACVLTEKGTVRGFAHGLNYDQNATLGSCDAEKLAALTVRHIIVDAPITNRDLPSSSGDVVLVAVTPQPFASTALWAALSATLSIIFGALCWMLGMRFEQMLLKPIRQIGSTAQRVSLYKDYSLRVVAGALTIAPREIEALIDSFNAMLHEIEDRDTRLTRKSEELEKSRHSAVSASLAKSQFLANVSHELRTPLNAIIGFSTMLEQQQFGPIGHAKYIEYARDIHDSGRHLLDVINDILDLTKAESGTLTAKFEALSLIKIVEKAINIIAGHAHERKIDIYTDLPEKLPKIYADRVRLVQILLNLLSNAIKFSGEGGKVIIRARAESAKNNIHYFTIEIEDKGIGMSEADINKAFSTFNQADAGLNRKYEGAGLGLPLTKRLIELHHGKIKIESTQGEGTTVTVRLTSDPALLD